MSLASSPSRPSLRGQFVDADFDLAGSGALLWQKRYSILRPTIIVALLTFGVVLMIPPKYQSEARVLVIGRDNIYLRPDADKDIIDRGVVDQEAVTSQAQLILSRDLASEVIAKLKLNELPEFDPALGNISLTKRVLGFLGVIRNPLAMTPEERVLEAYYDRLTVFPVEKSRVIVIDFLSENPELAARVANAIADAYLKRQQEAKQDQARSAGTWLSGEIENLRKKVADAEAKVEAFRARSNLLVGPNNTTLSVQQLGDLNTQLATARAQKSDAEAKARLIRDMLKSGEPIESSDILNSELIRRLSEQRVTLRAQLAEQSSSLLGNHPRIKELRAQIGDLDQQIRKEAEILARSLENDAKLADARVAAQLVTFNQLKKQAETSNEDDVQLRALERDAKSQRDLLEFYLAKYRDASARGTIESPPRTRVISRATPSSVPAYPKKLPTVLITTLAALVLVGAVLTRELLASPAAGATGASRRSSREFGFGTRAGSGAGNGAGTGATVAAAAEQAAETYVFAALAVRAAARRRAGVAGHARLAGGAGHVRCPRAHAGRRAGERHRGIRPQPASCRRCRQPDGVLRRRVRFRFRRCRGEIWPRARAPRAGGAGRTWRRRRRNPRDFLGSVHAGFGQLAAGTASFADIITKDRASALNLIAARAGAERSSLLAAPSMSRNFTALAHAYPHLVIDGGFVGGPDMPALARIAPHAVLLVEAASGRQATAKAREALIEAGFDNVTLLVVDRGATSAPTVAPPIPAAAA